MKEYMKTKVKKLSKKGHKKIIVLFAENGQSSSCCPQNGGAQGCCPGRTS